MLQTVDVEPYGFIARTQHNGELALTHTPPDVRWLDKLYQTANLQTGVRRTNEFKPKPVLACSAEKRGSCYMISSPLDLKEIDAYVRRCKLTELTKRTETYSRHRGAVGRQQSHCVPSLKV